jgi:hypothetical protein
MDVSQSVADIERVSAYDEGRQVPRCRGKAFEHHERTEIADGQLWQWRCPECGDSGSFETTLVTLAELLPLMHKLQEHFFRPVIAFLVPSDATPGRLGGFYGCDVYRVQGIPAPMVAMTALQVSRT